MKITATSLAMVIAFCHSSTAMLMSECSISHNSGDGGNQFLMHWQQVPSESQSTICGHFNEDLGTLVWFAGTDIKGSVSCSTSGSDMVTTLTLDKQSCESQANLIVEAMQEALGSAGTLANSNTCDFSGC